MGCSEYLSSDAASCNTSPSTATTSGLPSVMVPVLSKIIAFILCAISSTSPPFIKMPFSAPLPVPTIMAVGVASPKAQGQAITNTDIKILRANSILPPVPKNQATAATKATKQTMGTK